MCFRSITGARKGAGEKEKCASFKEMFFLFVFFIIGKPMSIGRRVESSSQLRRGEQNRGGRINERGFILITGLLFSADPFAEHHWSIRRY